MRNSIPFLSAEWRDLLLLNYEVDPAVLRTRLPAGTELDLWQGQALVSVVGFMMSRVRVLGLALPFHTRFAEVNLRFYVRRGSTRGVVFVKEIVPLFTVAAVARLIYGEPYVSLPLKQVRAQTSAAGEKIASRPPAAALQPGDTLEYAWRWRRQSHYLRAEAAGLPVPAAGGSEAQFITEHYWGYTRRSATRTGVYQVEHPPWQHQPVIKASLMADVAGLYGEEFAPFLQGEPRSAFLAVGSPVKVRVGETLKMPTPI